MGLFSGMPSQKKKSHFLVFGGMPSQTCNKRTYKTCMLAATCFKRAFILSFLFLEQMAHVWGSYAIFP